MKQQEQKTISPTPLAMQVEKGKQLAKAFQDNKYHAWVNSTSLVLQKYVGEGSDQYRAFRQEGEVLCSPSDAAPEWWTKFYKDGLQKQLALLEDLLQVFEMEFEAKESPDFKERTSNRIFIVHGRREGPREEVARFLECLDLEPIILHEQANEGRTIMEKFEKHSDVRFAVVLLTGDDVGALKSSPSDLKPRARQNVIFELGFFTGRLGRKNVTALYEAGVELPSDYQGIIYLSLDAGGAWKMQLAKELRAAGLSVDFNKLLRN